MKRAIANIACSTQQHPKLGYVLRARTGWLETVCIGGVEIVLFLHKEDDGKGPWVVSEYCSGAKIYDNVRTRGEALNGAVARIEEHTPQRLIELRDALISQHGAANKAEV